MKTRITREDIDEILKKTLIKTHKYGDQTLVLEAGLPNGFEIVVSYSSDNAENYDSIKAQQICMEKLVSKIFEFERYRLQSELLKVKKIKIEINVNEEDII